ncbi:MAG TPA: hypothetical protein VGK64_31615 [Bryobacteraceae bacterium]
MAEQNKNINLSALVSEHIADEQYAIEKRCWVELHGMLADFTGFAGLRLGAPPTPPQPKLPNKLFKILARYAGDLFRCESKYYPKSDRLEYWLSELVIKIERRVMDSIGLIEKQSFGTLAYHATRDEMRAAVQSSLLKQCEAIVKQGRFPAVREPSASIDRTITEAEIQQKERIQFVHSTAHRLEALLKESQMTNEEVAGAIGISVRSLYRHLNGGAIRKANRKAYGDLLSQKLGRKVTL